MPSTESITYSFVQFYYSKLHEDPSKLYQIYTNNAKLTHTKIPQSSDPNILNNLIETESFNSKTEIEKFYTASSFKNSKIRVSSIDSQSVLDNESILISVIGELALTDESPVYRFTQSFVLTPGKVVNSYDISNDIFRLIPDDDFELNQTEKPQDTEEDVKETLKKTVSDEAEPQQLNEEKKEDLKEGEPEVKAEAPIEKKEVIPEPKVEKKEEKKPKEVNQEDNKEAKDDTKPEAKAVEEEKEKEEEEEEEVKETTKEAVFKENEPVEMEKTSTASPSPGASSASGASMSWAQISSSNSTKPVTTVKPKRTPQPKKSSESPQPAVESKPSKPLTTSTTSTNGQAKPQSSRKRTERPYQERLYPVLILGIGNLKGPEITAGLEKEFGKTTKVEPRGHFALADFETAEAQKLALKKKSVKILSSTITIEAKPPIYDFKDKKKPNTNNPANNTSGSRPNKQKQNGNDKEKKKVVKQSA